MNDSQKRNIVDVLRIALRDAEENPEGFKSLILIVNHDSYNMSGTVGTDSTTIDAIIWLMKEDERFRKLIYEATSKAIFDEDL